MNDEDMLAAMRSSLTSVKDSLTGVHMDQPPEAITARARARRLRRGLSGAGAGSLALAIGLALAWPGGPPAARAVHVNLDAWSVNTTSAGLVDVTIRELKDPAGLQARLRADGVPINVSFSGPNPACVPYYPNYRYIPPMPVRYLGKAPKYPWIHSYDNGSVTVSVTSPADLTLALRPARMPRGTAFQIVALRGSVVAWGLVKTSPACTGLCPITGEDERAAGDPGARCDQDRAGFRMSYSES